MKNFKQLRIWQLGVDIAVSCFRLISHFPKDERYNLGDQIRRSAYSIPANIAEGSSRSSQKDQLRFIEISTGSAFELETHLHLILEFYPHLEDKVLEVQILLTSEMKMLQVYAERLRISLHKSPSKYQF